MRIVVINPILYTCETSKIKKVKTIKDSMIYNLCLEIKKQGHEPILIAAKDYKPIIEENYDFNIIFLETKWHKLFKPNCFPLLCGLNKALNNFCKDFDFIISGEVFSMWSLYVSLKYKKNTIIWHELAKHNNIMKKIPSKIWYNVIAKIFFHDTRIVARSKNAYEFIKKYCNNISTEIIDHGVDINKFNYFIEKEKQFIVVSQLIKRKHIDGIIKAFCDFLKEKPDFKLVIIGSGEEEKDLKKLVKSLNIEEKVDFKGQRTHEEIIPILSKSYALIINTEKDNSMLSIVEAIATCTPIITTPVPYNCSYILENELGIVTKKLNKRDFIDIVEKNSYYVENCMNYRYKVSNEFHVKQFVEEGKLLKNK